MKKLLSILGTLAIVVTMVLAVLPALPVSASPSIVGTTSNSAALRYSFDHGPFSAAGRQWVFYYDGTNVVFSSSTDGTTWASPTSVGASVTTYWCDYFDGTYVYYIRSSTNIYFRRGIPQSDGSITWSAADRF